MKYEIYYAVACSTGKVRSINQDNFYCPDEKCLNVVNDGLDGVKSYKAYSADYPAFAIFDGMGGEQYGEVAASIAAETFSKLKCEIKSDNIEDFLISSCYQMNNNITTFAKQKSVKFSGTTVAMLMCSDKEIYACNIGDSKIYHYNNKKLVQISKDYVINTLKNKKPALSQCLGIPENKFIIEPYIVRRTNSDNDYYLMCSDGLTDMLSEDEIENIISKIPDVEICVNTLLETTLSRGGRDNVTIILCKIQERNLN